MPRACLDCDEERDSEFCPECGAETEPVIECPECGALNLEGGMAYCHECEADLEG